MRIHYRGALVGLGVLTLISFTGISCVRGEEPKVTPPYRSPEINFRATIGLSRTEDARKETGIQHTFEGSATEVPLAYKLEQFTYGAYKITAVLEKRKRDSLTTTEVKINSMGAYNSMGDQWCYGSVDVYETAWEGYVNNVGKLVKTSHLKSARAASFYERCKLNPHDPNQVRTFIKTKLAR